MLSTVPRQFAAAVLGRLVVAAGLFVGSGLSGQQPAPRAPSAAHSAQATTPNSSPAAPKPLPKGQFPTEPITRTLLQRTDAPGMPGYETRLYLVEYGPNVKAPLHHHPVTGVGYVVSGGILSGFSGRYPNRYEAGQSFIDLAGEPHTISQNVSASEPVRMIIAYTVRGDDPVSVTP